jgi:DNA-directed RNA polymerase specialized sigma54-like protein
VSSDVNYGWQVLHQKLEQDIPTLNLALESKKWEVQNAVEQNVFLQDALREVKHVSNSIREAIRQKVEKDRWAQICLDNNVPTDELASFKAKIEAHLETLSIQEGRLPP